MRKIVFITVLSLSIISNSMCSFGQTRHPNHQHGKSNQADTQADTVEALHYDISVDTINYTERSLRAKTIVRLNTVADNVVRFSLSLQNFTIDSIISNLGSVSYTYTSPRLVVQPIQVLNVGDSIELSIYYHGMPQEDPGGWGGFTFSGAYAFNMGVGFTVDPHVYGRAWFPCIDNFTDRALYDFHITTSGQNQAHCNGALVSTDINLDGTRTWNWHLDKTIPTYLACMAVAPYTTIYRNSLGIPVEIAAVGTDSVGVLTTMAKLDTAVRCFVNNYGPYPWNKIGYSVVPFNAGAMEHATNISIGRPFLNGTLTYETLWVHELSHMWWGDLVTCKTEEDMWLNEGLASYNESIFTEAAYGKKAYKNRVRANHRQVLQYCHITDSSYMALNQIPHQYTYSTTVYDKGADIAHTLRKFMSDSLFSVGAKNYFTSLAYNHATSYDLRDKLAEATGINLENFFNDWVFTPGFPHFYIDSFKVTATPTESWLVDVYTRQRSVGNSNLYNEPIKINFSYQGNAGETRTFLIDSATNHFTLETTFPPTMVTIDRAEEMSDALVDYELKLKTSPNYYDVPETAMSIKVVSEPADSVLLRVEHHYVAPDSTAFPETILRLSDRHFWKIDGQWNSDFICKAKFNYNGSNSTNGGYMDNTFITGNEGYLRILYREACGKPWQLVSGFTLNKLTNATNKIGNIEVDTLRKGEYTFGWSTEGLGISRREKAKARIIIFPNPSKDLITLNLSALHRKQEAQITIQDLQGKLLFTTPIMPNTDAITIPISEFQAGQYLINVVESGRPIGREKFVVE